MSQQVAVSACVVGVLSVMAPVGAAPAAAQNEALRTAWGDPDLQGIWDFSTITPLERSEGLADKEYLTEQEAANLEQGSH